MRRPRGSRAPRVLGDRVPARGRDGPGSPFHSGPGTPRRRAPAREAESSARTKYYGEKAREVALRNRVREGELIEAKEAEDRYGRLVGAFRDAVLQLPGTLVQRGWVAREREADVEAVVHHCLRHLAEQGRSAPWTPPEADA